MMIASVIVNLKNNNIDKSFDYLIPSYLDNLVFIGQRVIVEFNNKPLMGFIVELKEKSNFNNLGYIKEILDIEPCIDQELVKLAYNMHKYYFSLYINCLLTMIPQALRVEHKKKFIIKNETLVPLGIRELFTKDTLLYNSKYQEYLPELLQGVKNNSLELIDEIKDKNNIQFDKYISINNKEIKLNSSQQEIIDYLDSVNNLELKTNLVNKFSVARVKTLLDKGALIEIKKEHFRAYDKDVIYNDKKVILNDEQKDVLAKIREKYNTNETFLLHGITGSGKTEIYLNVLEDIIKENKTAILLVPEISLTAQIVARIKGRFKDDVALLHSGLSIGEKYDEWRRIIKGNVKIVVGARSAIFAPLKNIGAIIIDEEHEKSYIQENSPQYDARLIAKIRAHNHNAIVILGSATPSIESYYKAQNGIYNLLELKTRANQRDVPNVKIVSMKEEIKNDNPIISAYLDNKIKDRLNKGEQIMLLLNRRGYSSYLMCRECSEIIKCPHCNVSLTYHKTTKKMLCHYCGYEEKVPDTCPNCKSKKLRFMGLGTEKVLEELANKYPDANIIRMDADNTKNKGAHEKIINKFSNQEADILVGTQMIAKGLDFPKVTLVGILSADQSLNIPTFDATTDAYQLFVQVSGRAGRHDLEGEVILQTYDSSNYVIKSAKEQDYNKFYSQELNYRKLGSYPPFNKLIEILVIGASYEDTFIKATEIVKKLINNKNINVLGPAEDMISKIGDKYRFKIIVKYQKEADLNNDIIDLYKNSFKNKNYYLVITRRY